MRALSYRQSRLLPRIPHSVHRCASAGHAGKNVAMTRGALPAAGEAMDATYTRRGNASRRARYTKVKSAQATPWAIKRRSIVVS